LWESHETKIQTAEMKLLRQVAGYTDADHSSNREIREKLEVFNVQEQLAAVFTRN